MESGRIYRLLHVITLLQSNRYYSVRQLSELGGMSRRTVFRDLQALRGAGIPVAFDASRRGYRISERFFLPPTTLTVDEALAMILLSRQLGDQDGIPFQQAAVAAAVKLEGALPETLRREIAPLAGAARLAITRLADHTGSRDTYTQLLLATSQGCVVRLYYDSLFEGRVVRTRLKPYRLLFVHHAWYVIGYSSMHRAQRLFNLVRVKKLEPTDERFTVPRTFSLDRFLGNAWHLIRGEESFRVVLRFSPKVARNVAEVRWHKTQRVRPQPDGSIEFHVTVDGIDEIAWWVLGYGDQVRVIEPECLRDRIREVAGNMLRQYTAEAQAPSPT